MEGESSITLTPSAVDNLNKSKSCKRTINFKIWKDVERKKRREAGLEYTSRKKKILVPALNPPSGDRICGNGCKKNCPELTLEVRKSLYEKFRSLNYDDQSAMLLCNLRLGEPIKRHSGYSDATSRKLCAFEYTLENKQVCRKTVLDTYQISPKRLQILQEKMKNGDKLPKDRRGKHKNRPHAIPQNDRNLIVSHIEKFPKQESHYSRQNTSKNFLSAELSISKMYRNFISENPHLKISKTLYTRVFKTLNLRFGAPRSDTCKICDGLSVKLSAADSEIERTKIRLETELHQSKAALGYNELREDVAKSKMNSAIVVLCFDMQQVLFCPTLTHSDIFYQRQLSCYNLNIHNMGTNIATMNLWYECIAGRGSTEIASSLLKYITMNFSPLKEGEEKKLIIWSDRCVGQNNNWRVLNMLCFVAKSGYFTEVNQKFLTSGHSFLPCDRDFALIEKKKKSAKVYIPSEWKDVIAKAKENDPFQIVEMEQADFKNFTSIEQHLPAKKDSSGMKITKFVWYKYTMDDPCTIRARSSHNVIQPWQNFTIYKENWVPNIKPNELPQEHQNLLPITKGKKNDLLKMIPYIDKKYKEFYDKLPFKTRD